MGAFSGKERYHQNQKSIGNNPSGGTISVPADQNWQPDQQRRNGEEQPQPRVNGVQNGFSVDNQLCLTLVLVFCC